MPLSSMTCLLSMAGVAVSNLPVTDVAPCPRPPNWCESGGGNKFLIAYYRDSEDCDGDGIPDHQCSDSNGDFGFISSAASCQQKWPRAACGGIEAPTPKWYHHHEAWTSPCWDPSYPDLFTHAWKRCCSGLFGSTGHYACWEEDSSASYHRCCILWPQNFAQILLPVHEERIKVGLSTGQVLDVYQQPGRAERNHYLSQNRRGTGGVAVMYPGGYALARWADLCAPVVQQQDKWPLQALELGAGIGVPGMVLRTRWFANVTVTEISPSCLAVLRHRIHRLREVGDRFKVSEMFLHVRQLDIERSKMWGSLAGKYDIVVSSCIGSHPAARAAAALTAWKALAPCGVAVFLESEKKIGVLAAAAAELFGAENQVLNDGPIPWDDDFNFTIIAWQRSAPGGCSRWPWGVTKRNALSGDDVQQAKPMYSGCLD